APGGILLSTANGQRRVLAHLYNTTSNYTFYSFAKLSSDGNYVLFTSNMNGSARSDLFLAEMPTSGAPPPPGDTTPPTVPTGLATNPVSSSQINLSWNASTDSGSGVAGYKVFRGGVQIGTTAAITYSDTGLSPSTTYTYTVSSYDVAGNNSAQCPGVNGTTQAPPPPPPSDTTPPTVPTGLAATPVSSTQINLTWNASTDSGSGVAGYKIFRGGSQIATSVATSYSDTGLSPSTTYTYTVSAYDVAGNNSAQCPGVMATTQAAPPPPPPPTNGIIAFLHLDENAGSTVFNDATGSANNGSCSGTGCPTSGVAGKVGHGLSFDGVSDLVTITHNNGLNAFPLTVSTWFKTNSTTGVVGLVNKYVGGSYNGYNVFLNNGNVCAWYLKDASNYAYDGSGCTFNIAGYNNNAWHQVVYVVDSSGGKLYLDGVQKGTTVAWTGVAGVATTTQDIHLGHYPGAFGGAEYFLGSLDEVRIYNTALTASDVTNLYNADNAPPADTTPPTVSITAPANGATVSGTVSVSANASDNVGVVGVQFLLDGANLNAEDTTAPYSTSWDTRTATNGSHTITAVARDAAGNRTTSGPVTVTVSNSTPDTTPPTVSITAPAAGATVSGTVSVKANASDNVGVVGVQFLLDGANLNAEDTSAPYSTSWDTTTAMNGSHTLTAVARDAAGNRTTSGPVTVTVSNSTPDTTPPTVPTGLMATPVSSTQINLTWNASSDSGSGVAGYKVFRGGSQIGTSVSTSYSDTGLSPSTTYSYTVSAYDVAGNNSAQCPSVMATTQAAPPPPPTNGIIAFLHLDENAGSTVFSDATGSANNGSCSGTGCPTSGVAGKVGHGLSFDGVSDLVTITHNNGLNAFPLTVSTWFKTNSTAGVVGLVNKYVGGSYNGYNVFLNNGNVCAWYLRDASNNVYDGSGCTFNIAGYNDNAWHQVVYVVDSSGGKLYLDGVQKGTTVAWTGSAGVPTTTQDIHLAHYPGAFGGAEYFLGSLDEVRIYNVALTASDVNSLYAADNSSPASPPPADTTPPTVTITAPAGGATVSGIVTVSADASDNIGVVGVQFLLDGANIGAEDTSAPFETMWDTTLTSNASHMLTAIARDAAGNRTTSAAVQVSIINIIPDTVPPTVAITVPSNGATVMALVPVTASASDNVGVIGVQFYLDGATLGAEDTVAPYTINWDTTTTANGSHTLTAVARDAAGNKTTSAANQVNVSNTQPVSGPVVTITNPPSGATVSGTMEIDASVLNFAAVGVKFYVDGIAVGLEDNFAPFTCSWNTAQSTNGSHTLTAVARDLAGHVINSAAVTVTVSNAVRKRPHR
ncbi:MAG TPA: Ig-like domain-containing protein, partial [Thermoanaerobaculia bacterium]|nr:Ig-like domain-containing protein [Thermoanaerobaculia bacterium]